MTAGHDNPLVPPVCVAGMHRSGTSMVARLLQVCGLYLGPESELLPARSDNADGFWEHRGFVQVNTRVLNEWGGDWDCPPPVPPTPTGDAPHIAAASPSAEADADALVASFAAAADPGPWGWKDPRNSLTLPFWMRRLVGLRTVVCVRHPLEVALSLHRRHGMSYTFALGLWSAYNHHVLAAAPPDARLVTHYESYLEEGHASGEVRRMAAFAGLAPANDALNAARDVATASLRHNRFAAADLAVWGVPGSVSRLYARLCDEAARPDLAPPVPSAPCETSAAADDGSLPHQLARAEAKATGLARACAEQARELESERRARADAEYALSASRAREAVREVARAAGARAASVLVVSRGDEALVPDGARHFPQHPDGFFAGHYPADGREAVDHLELLRRRGAQFLLFPASAGWWLDHYADLAAHVRGRYRVVYDRDGCLAFDLRAAVPTRAVCEPAGQAVAPAERGEAC